MQYVTTAVARWNALPKGTRLTVATAFAGISIGLMLAVLATHPSKSALFATPLHPEQLSEVEERLAAWNVAFTPAADNVVVQTSSRSDLLLRLSLAGVPHPHLETTTEAMAGIGVLTPQAVIDAQARTGLAGDIAGGLRGIDGIEDARVIVAPAKAAEFADEPSRVATASVRLRLRAGAHLSRTTVSGIRRFVAASVTGLDPSHVTIVDDAGAALGDADGEEASDAQAALQSALDAAFGDGATIVRVHSEFETARVSASPKRISTAIFVDEARAGELAKVRDLAAATVGYDERRGDALVVQAVDFGRSPVARKDPWWLLYGAIVPLAPVLVTALAAVVVSRQAIPAGLAVLQRTLE
ncbi:MAG: hypothetical protein JO199_14365, partial [Candidatus Eremiobacteraeota bacterium]|nr:hypothetical protein [Candidatus Eremiobacteraeota bacterium]